MLNIILACVLMSTVCSAIVANYDMLVGDVSFYNQTLGFALCENKEYGENMLHLLENLMAPWDEQDNPTKSENVVPIDFQMNETENAIVVNSILTMAAISFVSFYVIVVFMVLSLPFNIYTNIRYAYYGEPCKINTMVV